MGRAEHGYGIAQRLQQVSDDVLHLNQGTLYPALLRLEQRGWISSTWGTSENNRRARFYTLTRANRKQLRQEAVAGDGLEPCHSPAREIREHLDRHIGHVIHRRGRDDEVVRQY